MEKSTFGQILFPLHLVAWIFSINIIRDHEINRYFFCETWGVGAFIILESVTKPVLA